MHSNLNPFQIYIPLHFTSPLILEGLPFFQFNHANHQREIRDKSCDPSEECIIIYPQVLDFRSIPLCRRSTLTLFAQTSPDTEEKSQSFIYPTIDAVFDHMESLLPPPI